jgi:hypothetical protein
MTEESLQKLFVDVKNTPAETNVADVSQWIDAAAVIDTTTIIQKLLQKKIIIMSSIITATMIGAIILFSTDGNNKKEKQVIPIIEKNTISGTSTTTNPVVQNKKSENLLPITQPAIIDTPAALNLIPAQKEALQIENETPKIINSDTNELPQKNEDYISSGSWKSKNDSLLVDTVFNGIKALIFKGRVNDIIFVNGSNRTNVAMNFNYKYKVKGLYSRKNMECEVSYEKKDSVLSIQIDRKNPVNIGVSYSKEASNLSFEVPENIAVQIKTSFGNIDVSGLKNNDFDFQTTYGDIDVSLLSGNVNLYSGYGDIDFNDLNGKIDIKTSYGNVNGKNIAVSEHMNIKSGYGDIDCQIINPITDCDLDLKTGYGKVKIKRTDLKLEAGTKLIFGAGKIKLTVKSGYGDVIIR